jgi:hypothetical protein
MPSTTLGVAGARVRLLASERSLLESVRRGVLPLPASRARDVIGVLVARDEELPPDVREALVTAPTMLMRQMPDAHGGMLQWYGRRLDVPTHGAHVIFVPELGTAVASWPTTRRAAVVGPRASLVSQLVIKDVLRAALWPTSVTFHAAAVARRGRAILYIGGNGSGKTTLTLATCLATGVSYVAGDRTLLEERGAKLTALGWPTRIRVAPGTLERPEIKASGFADSARRSDLQEKGKFVVDPAELEDLGIALAGERLDVAACVFPTLAHGTRNEPQELVPIDPVEAHRRLEECILAWPEVNWPHWSEWFPGDRTNPLTRKTVERLSERVPSFTVSLMTAQRWPLREWLKRLA